MSDIVIKVENISKQYRLGNVGLGSISHDLNRWYQTTLRGKEDPYLKIGDVNDRSVKGESEYVWALRDINFEVKHGEVLGIIGRNGAGKSTLLKILSRTTSPTTGEIKIKGRVASLLEVGTGFHPELTGRENIFLNGAILGMSKKEIKSKFDEIVDFAGVERYIDTPVKRYSSGMYVRLAFGVAAHLEPEILIVDEVLAVGDAEFQKKALGKMKDVSSREGRTVLFVSHNMQAIENLCDQAILLQNGYIIKKGHCQDVVQKYFSNLNLKNSILFNDIDGRISHRLQIHSIYIFPDTTRIEHNANIEIELLLKATEKQSFYINFILRTMHGDVVFEHPTGYLNIDASTIKVKFSIPGCLLNEGVYNVQFNFNESPTTLIASLQDVMQFEIATTNVLENYYGKRAGTITPNIKFSLVQL